MTCPHCNRQINPQDTFCNYCGKVVVKQPDLGSETVDTLKRRSAEAQARINTANEEIRKLAQQEQQLLTQNEDLRRQEADLQHAEANLSRKREELQQAQAAFRREAEEIGFHAE